MPSGIDSEFDKRVAETLKIFEEACEKSGYFITGDGRVNDEAASYLTGYAVGSLKNMRTLGTSPPFYKRGFAGGKISYRLKDIAVWLEKSKEEVCDF